MVGGVRADAHHPSDQRMTNRNITISNNRIHDLGLDYRGIVSVLTTYVADATVSYNEVYNMPYTGMSIGYGWGANDTGGNTQYANRGLYNYQPRYTHARRPPPTTRLIGNYVHDVMQQMNDGGCIYTLSWNPGAVISDNHCLRTNGLLRRLLRRGVQVLHRQEQRLPPRIGSGPPPTTGAGRTWATGRSPATGRAAARPT